MNRKPFTRIASLLLFGVLLFGSSAVAAEEGIVIQSTDLSGYPEVVLRVALPADLVPARAGDSEPEFSVRENSVDIAAVNAEAEAEIRDPIDVVLVIDVSGSMQGKPLADAKAASRSFIDAMSVRDRVAVVAFASEPEVLAELTAERGELQRAVDSLEARGQTALYDAIVRGIDLLAADAQSDDRYVIVLSDGGDNTSINSLDTAVAAVVESGVPVFGVALESAEYNPEPLRVLSERSGGKTVSVTESDAFTAIFQEIAQELRNIYVVSYVSLEPATADLNVELLVARGDVRSAKNAVLQNPLFTREGVPTTDSVVATPSANPFWRVMATLLAFGTVGLLVFAVGSILARPSTTLDQLEYYTHANTGPLVADAHPSGAGGTRDRVLDALSSFANTRGFTAAVRLKLERAGMPLRPNEYMFFHILTVLGAGIVIQGVAGHLIVTATAIAIVTLLPIVLLDQAVAKRRRRFEEQLPDVLSLVAGSLRSGWGISQSIDLVVEEVAEPAGSEFHRAQSENRIGLPLEEALARMAERVDSDDFRWAVAAIAIQRDVGGNLAEVLDTVAATIRERAELRRQVSALTAESRFSALVLVILPFFLLIALYIINPEYMSALLGSAIGQGMLAFGALLLAVGSWWLMRLTKVEV